MAAFVVLLREQEQDDPAANREAAERLKIAYPEHFELGPTAYLVKDDLLQTVAAHLDIDDDDRIRGVIFRLNGTYWGRERQLLWDWLDSD